MKKYIILVMLLIVGCFEGSVNNNEFPDIESTFGVKVLEEGIIYQFYEKFGFTDVCQHNRVLCKTQNLELDSTWKPLPISKLDLSTINNIGNKIDTFTSNGSSVIYNKKEYFSDISIRQLEYIKKESTNFIFDLNFKNGYYYLDLEQFKIYDSTQKVLYCEVHRCL